MSNEHCCDSKKRRRPIRKVALSPRFFQQTSRLMVLNRVYCHENFHPPLKGKKMAVMVIVRIAAISKVMVELVVAVIAMKMIVVRK